MAITKTSTALQFGGSASVTVSSATQADSDAFTFDATSVGAGVVVSADNAGTPSSGDVVDVYVKYTTGDVLGDTGDDYPTNEHAEYLGRLDTVSANSPGEDPARKAFVLDPLAYKGFRLSYVCPQAASRNIVLRAMVNETKAA